MGCITLLSLLLLGADETDNTLCDIHITVAV
jgi:hypothetical protein